MGGAPWKKRGVLSCHIISYQTVSAYSSCRRRRRRRRVYVGFFAAGEGRRRGFAWALDTAWRGMAWQWRVL